MPLRVLALADEVSRQLYDYFDPDRWKNIDLVLSAGDIPPSFLDFLATALNVPVFYVRGNHDAKFPESEYAGCDDVHGRIVSYRGIRIVGFEGSMRYNEGGAQYSEAQMRRITRRAHLRSLVSGRPDIVLTHAPIAHVHDGCDVCHRGFACYRHLIDVWHPRYFVHGHTHRHYSREAITDIDGTTVINAFPFQVFEVEPNTAPQPTRPSARARLLLDATADLMKGHQVTRGH